MTTTTAEDTSGFYKLDANEMLYAPNFVSGPSFSLRREEPADWARAVEGWAYFTTAEEAYAAYGLTPPA